MSRTKPKVTLAGAPSNKSNAGVALGIAAGGVLLSAAGIVALRRMTDD